jgi:hypothetical protein
MDNLARKRRSGDVRQATGTVVRVEAGRIVVRLEDGLFDTKRATSCLVQPTADDRVLVAMDEHEAWVLAVLEREAGAAVDLVADADLRVRLPHGRFAVTAQSGVDLVTPGDVRVLAGKLTAHAKEGLLALARTSFVGSFLRTEVSRIEALAETMDAVVGSLSQRLVRSHRVVEDLDHSRVGAMTLEVEKTLAIASKNAVVTAEELVKVDGEQIHLG